MRQAATFLNFTVLVWVLVRYATAPVANWSTQAMAGAAAFVLGVGWAHPMLVALLKEWRKP